MLLLSSSAYEFVDSITLFHGILSESNVGSSFALPVWRLEDDPVLSRSSSLASDLPSLLSVPHVLQQENTHPIHKLFSFNPFIVHKSQAAHEGEDLI